MPRRAPRPAARAPIRASCGSDKSGVMTSTTDASKVWATVQKKGGLGEIYYPDIGTPSARALRFVVADRAAGSASAGRRADAGARPQEPELRADRDRPRRPLAADHHLHDGPVRRDRPGRRAVLGQGAAAAMTSTRCTSRRWPTRAPTTPRRPGPAASWPRATARAPARWSAARPSRRRPTATAARATATPTSPTAGWTGSYTSAGPGSVVQTARLRPRRRARDARARLRRRRRRGAGRGPRVAGPPVRGDAGRLHRRLARLRRRPEATRRRRCAATTSGACTTRRRWSWPPARTRRTAARTSPRRRCRGAGARRRLRARTTWCGRATCTRSRPG